MKFAPPGDPLVTNKGTLVEAEGRVEPKYARTVPLVSEAGPKTLRSMKELGVDPQTQTIVNAVLTYQLIGITTNEIAYHLGTTPEEVDKIKALPSYNDTWRMMFQTIISASSNSLQARLAAYAPKALENVMDLADAKPIRITSEDSAGNKYEHDHYDVPPIVIMKANDSILDRAGLSGELLFGEANEDSNSQLEIEIVSSGDNKTNVKVNMNGNRKG
jgi:hypothetical protein